MFSSGNVTEKLRVSRFHCENETVVDLYAGKWLTDQQAIYCHKFLKMKSKAKYN